MISRKTTQQELTIDGLVTTVLVVYSWDYLRCRVQVHSIKDGATHVLHKVAPDEMEELKDDLFRMIKDRIIEDIKQNTHVETAAELAAKKKKARWRST